ncbi:MAG: TatD family hydrolase [Bacilli bacterium]|nr:TatD family hydrolase [Bacilli bacterium]
MYIDTHCHILKEDYDDIDKVIKEDFEVVDKIIVSGCEKESIEESLELIEKYDNVYATLGYHPEQVDRVTDEDLIELEKLLDSPKVVGLGEIGLDYHYEKDKKDDQIKLFEKQLSIAEKKGIPVLVHSREATEDTIKCLKKYKVHGIIHAFSGSYETGLEYIKMGYLLGIGGVVTFTNSNLGEVVSKLGVEHLVLETDAPYLIPHPFRGRGMKNSSKYIPFIARKISAVTGKTVDEVGEITSENALRVFDLNSK